MQRTLIIIATIVILLGGGAGVYFYFFSGGSGLAVSPSGTGSATFPEATQGTTASSTGSSSGQASGVAAAPTKVSSRLIQIDQGPVVPGEVLTTVPAQNASSSPDIAVHYIKRESGNVYSYLINAETLTRTSNRTIPGIQEAAWLPDASMAFVRFLSGADFSTINTYRLAADGSSGTMLATNISDVQTASSSLLTVASGDGGSIATISNPDGSKPSNAFSTPLTMIHSQITDNGYLVYTKPSATLNGYAFLVNKKGVFTRIAGPLKGLVALASPTGKYAVVSYVDGSAIKTELVTTATGAATALPISTIADKCVWAKDESSVYCGVPVTSDTNYTYPDDWYQGAAHFSDRIWKIDVQGRYAALVLDFSGETKTELDATALAIDENNQDIVFLNKNDGSLWLYRL